MMKKILASLMAVLMAFGVCMIIAAAEAEEPETPETPAYTPVEYQIADLVAAAEGKGDVYLQPTDIILLPEAPKTARMSGTNGWHVSSTVVSGTAITKAS